METALLSPAKAWVFFLPARALSIAIVLVGLTIFAVLLARRLKPMLRAAPDRRFDRLSERVFRVLKIWLAQWRQPRYLAAGILHIVIFAGFLCLSVRSVQMVILGMVDGFVFPGFSGPADPYIVGDQLLPHADAAPARAVTLGSGSEHKAPPSTTSLLYSI